jgi:hypothetical protein
MAHASHAWHPQEEAYLTSLAKACETLSIRYTTIHVQYKAMQARIKIPVIIASSIAGLISFGTGTFPPDAAKVVSIVVGTVNCAIAIAGSIDAFFQYQMMLDKAHKCAAELRRLKDEIDFELNMCSGERATSGILACRKAFGQYDTIIEGGPAVLKRPRFVLPSISAPDLPSSAGSMDSPFASPSVAAQIL